MDTLDFEKLSKTVDPDTTRLPYEQVKQSFTKVAFDVFRMNDAPYESYWVLEKDEDGQEYLVAQYEDKSDIEVKSNWEALADKTASNITLYYKGVPVRRCTASEFGFDHSDVHIFAKTLTTKLAQKEELVDMLLDTLPENVSTALAQQFPELKKKP